MPLGTIDTGCIDLENNGTFGFSTIFNTHTPQRGGSAVRMPALALSVGGKTWALCREATTTTDPLLLPHVAEWLPADLGAGQPAWAVNATGVPGWAKSVGISVCDIPQGRVFCHNPTVLRWTSPVRGQVEIRGGMWVCRNIGRVQKWELRRNGVRFTDGQLAWGPTSAAPQPYASGSGGPAALHVAVEPGDRIELVLERAEVCEDFVGVDFSIVDTAAGKTWDVAADWSDTQNPNGPWTYDDARRRQFDLFQRGALPSIARADEIHYWGHYPSRRHRVPDDGPRASWLARMEFLRARGIGGVADSGRRIRNALAKHVVRAASRCDRTQLPGLVARGGRCRSLRAKPLSGEFCGVEVTSPQASYAMGVVGAQHVRLGSDLGCAEADWAAIGTPVAGGD